MVRAMQECFVHAAFAVHAHKHILACIGVCSSLPLHKFKLIQFESVCNPYNSIMTCAHNLHCLSRLFIVAPLLLFFCLFCAACLPAGKRQIYNSIQAKWQTQTWNNPKTIQTCCSAIPDSGHKREHIETEFMELIIICCCSDTRKQY